MDEEDFRSNVCKCTSLPLFSFVKYSRAYAQIYTVHKKVTKRAGERANRPRFGLQSVLLDRAGGVKLSTIGNITPDH